MVSGECFVQSSVARAQVGWMYRAFNGGRVDFEAMDV